MPQYRLDDDQGGQQPPKPWKSGDKPGDGKDEQEEGEEEKKAA